MAARKKWAVLVLNSSSRPLPAWRDRQAYWPRMRSGGWPSAIVVTPAADLSGSTAETNAAVASRLTQLEWHAGWTARRLPLI